MEGKNIANRSKQHYKAPNGVAVTSMAVCDGGQSLGAATLDGAINILRIDPSGNKYIFISFCNCFFLVLYLFQNEFIP